MRIGLVGCGNVGLSGHLPALLATDGIAVSAVADPTPERLAAAGQAAGLPEDACHADWRDLVARPEIDAVVVATPQRVRPGIALAAARAGKHLLCEKPLAIAPADAHRMVEAARQANVTLATVHNYTQTAVYRALKAALDGGALGALEVARLDFLSVEDRPGNPDYAPRWRHDLARSGGGVLMDMLHAVYLAGWFFGGDPVAVAATVDRRADDGGDVEDLALVRYEYPTGHALVNVAWGLGPGGTTLMGTKGRAVTVTADFGTHPFVAAERVALVTAGGARDLPLPPDETSSFVGVARNFRDAVAAGRAPLASGEAGAATLEAVVGAYAAAALGREVALPLDPADPVFVDGAAGIARLRISPQNPVWRRGLFGVRQPPGG
ncbi:MAG: GH109 [uncultured Thermomicrobiales bacterium]|uniref:GH109 n=1 Tax=uncultured Thermomicrobiales bacterium TaxID=1645740 RepID=A0A6J4UHB2_9BACT|nr:MAG: GH109 [uncultured Thermomicrobiales bacterium]